MTFWYVLASRPRESTITPPSPSAQPPTFSPRCATDEWVLSLRKVREHAATLEVVTNEVGDTGSAPTRPRRIGHKPDLVGPDFEQPPPRTEVAVWETPGPACHDESGAVEEWFVDEVDDWPFDDLSVDVQRLRQLLLKSEADLAAGRTFGEDDIRARYGLPRFE